MDQSKNIQHHEQLLAKLWQLRGVEPITLRVLAAIVSRMQAGKWSSFPSANWIADYAELTQVRTVYGHVKKLEEKGWLAVEKEKGSSNQYRLTALLFEALGLEGGTGVVSSDSTTSTVEAVPSDDNASEGGSVVQEHRVVSSDDTLSNNNIIDQDILYPSPPLKGGEVISRDNTLIKHSPSFEEGEEDIPILPPEGRMEDYPTQIPPVFAVETASAVTPEAIHASGISSREPTEHGRISALSTAPSAIGQRRSFLGELQYELYALKASNGRFDEGEQQWARLPNRVKELFKPDDILLSAWRYAMDEEDRYFFATDDPTLSEAM